MIDIKKKSKKRIKKGKYIQSEIIMSHVQQLSSESGSGEDKATEVLKFMKGFFVDEKHHT